MKRRDFILATGAVIGSGCAGPQVSNTGLENNAVIENAEAGFLNDASQQSRTPIHKHIIISEDPDAKLLSALRSELASASSEGRPVSIGAARHSMGGQAIPRNGHAITLNNGLVEPGDRAYRAHAGARWRDVFAALDPVGLSPKVMQSNNDFGVAASFSVNAHGWPTAFGPMGSTVRSIKILMADGSHIKASPRENSEIFFAAMGGYGLIGLITELEIDAVANTLVEPHFQVMPAEAFGAAFMQAARQSPMAYGRMNIDRENFFQEAVMVSFTEGQNAVQGSAGSELLYGLTRTIFRAQSNSDWFKQRRWDIETKLAPLVVGETSRSAQMNKSVAQINGPSVPTRADILHEYFVDPSKFADFVRACRTIILASRQDLLNVTLRWIEQDPNSMLSYAPNGPRIAAVMNFGQELTQSAEDDAIVMTRRLIDAVHDMGGSYYLPYRPHATAAQFDKGYGKAEEFASLKRRLDPNLLFTNALWDKYLAGY